MRPESCLQHGRALTLPNRAKTQQSLLGELAATSRLAPHRTREILVRAHRDKETHRTTQQKTTCSSAIERRVEETVQGRFAEPRPLIPGNRCWVAFHRPANHVSRDLRLRTTQACTVTHHRVQVGIRTPCPLRTILATLSQLFNLQMCQ